MSTSAPDSDRTWAKPSRSHNLRMCWHDLLFAHWSFEPSSIGALLPEGVELDTFDGKAWIGVVPFRMTDVAPRGIPAIPWMSAFPELNVRTYVIVDGKPGVWFFSLDATNPVAVRVARAAFKLPYMDAKISMNYAGDEIHFQSRRVHRGEPSADLSILYRGVGEPFCAKPGSLEYWLTARYCLYAVDRSGRVLRGEIDHSPWQLQSAEAEIETNTMISWLGLEKQEQPHLLYVHAIKVVAWTNQHARSAQQ